MIPRFLSIDFIRLCVSLLGEGTLKSAQPVLDEQCASLLVSNISVVLPHRHLITIDDLELRPVLPILPLEKLHCSPDALVRLVLLLVPLPIHLACAPTLEDHFFLHTASQPLVGIVVEILFDLRIPSSHPADVQLCLFRLLPERRQVAVTLLEGVLLDAARHAHRNNERNGERVWLATLKKKFLCFVVDSVRLLIAARLTYLMLVEETMEVEGSDEDAVIRGEPNQVAFPKPFLLEMPPCGSVRPLSKIVLLAIQRAIKLGVHPHTDLLAKLFDCLFQQPSLPSTTCCSLAQVLFFECFLFLLPQLLSPFPLLHLSPLLLPLILLLLVLILTILILIIVLF
mmetsp:Transcript_75342/g.189544  ORF Transcript_75342/g.189544 Transcript_75342/m.189544 type:complete len:341 (-) Transcript_75342:157-1179(-)